VTKHCILWAMGAGVLWFICGPSGHKDCSHCQSRQQMMVLQLPKNLPFVVAIVCRALLSLLHNPGFGFWAILDGRNQLKNLRWVRAVFEVCPTGHRLNGPLSLALECRRLHRDNVPQFAANPLAKCGATFVRTCGSTRCHL